MSEHAAAMADLLAEIDSVTDPLEMDQVGALKFLEELQTEIVGRIEALKSDIELAEAEGFDPFRDEPEYEMDPL